MAQASGSSAEIWYKIEQSNGVTPSDDSGASTTLASAVNPGATSITVASGTGIAAGEILRVGNSQNMEFVKVDSSYVSGDDGPSRCEHEDQLQARVGGGREGNGPDRQLVQAREREVVHSVGRKGAAKVAGTLGLARALEFP